MAQQKGNRENQYRCDECGHTSATEQEHRDHYQKQHKGKQTTPGRTPHTARAKDR